MAQEKDRASNCHVHSCRLIDCQRSLIQGFMWYHLTQKNTLSKCKAGFSHKAVGYSPQFFPNIVRWPLIGEGQVHFSSIRRRQNCIHLSPVPAPLASLLKGLWSWFNAELLVSAIVSPVDNISDRITFDDLKYLRQKNLHSYFAWNLRIPPTQRRSRQLLHLKYPVREETGVGFSKQVTSSSIKWN